MKSLPQLVASGILLSASLHAETATHFSLHEMTHEHFINIFQDNASSTIIYIKEGTRLPLNISSNEGIFSIENPTHPAVLVVNKPFYVKIVPALSDADCSLCEGTSMNVEQPTFLFSHDEVSWESFENFFSGHIHAGVSADEESSSPFAQIAVELQFKS